MVRHLSRNEERVAGGRRTSFAVDFQCRLAAGDKIILVLVVKCLKIFSVRQKNTSLTQSAACGSMSQTPFVHFSFAGNGSFERHSSIVNFFFPSIDAVDAERRHNGFPVAGITGDAEVWF